MASPDPGPAHLSQLLNLMSYLLLHCPFTPAAPGDLQFFRHIMWPHAPGALHLHFSLLGTPTLPPTWLLPVYPSRLYFMSPNPIRVSCPSLTSWSILPGNAVPVACSFCTLKVAAEQKHFLKRLSLLVPGTLKKLWIKYLVWLKASKWQMLQSISQETNWLPRWRKEGYRVAMVSRS